jgi:hypothetical protein
MSGKLVLPEKSFPGSTGMQGPPSAGFCFFWLLPQKVDDAGSLPQSWRAQHKLLGLQPFFPQKS